MEIACNTGMCLVTGAADVHGKSGTLYTVFETTFEFQEMVTAAHHIRPGHSYILCICGKPVSGIMLFFYTYQEGNGIITALGYIAECEQVNWFVSGIYKEHTILVEDELAIPVKPEVAQVIL
jgi:hypothetical protein